MRTPGTQTGFREWLEASEKSGSNPDSTKKVFIKKRKDMKIFLLILSAIIGVLILSWVLALNDIAFQSVFRPMQENVNRKVFENTKSYNQGMVQELQSMQFEYIKAPKEQQGMLASIILQKTADFNLNRLPIELKSFIEELKRNKGVY